MPLPSLRIWDYSDPANAVLASTFDTECSASTEPEPPCDPADTYSVHNVIVEEKGNHVLAYLSWYWDGMLVVDVTDPYNPVEVARFFNNSPEFIEANGGNPHDFWGVHKLPPARDLWFRSQRRALHIQAGHRRLTRSKCWGGSHGPSQHLIAEGRTVSFFWGARSGACGSPVRWA